MTILVGLDIGTTNIKAVAYHTPSGKVLYTAAILTPVIHYDHSRSEHDPELLWKACLRVLQQLSSKLNGNRIIGLALSSMADTGVVIDSTGRALYPIVAWYDQRCSQQVTWLANQIDPSRYNDITGQRFSTSLGISKWLWLKDNVSGIQAPGITYLSISDYVLWRLTGKKATDYSMASRMGFLDQRTLQWSEEIIKLVGLFPEQLPCVYASGTFIGTLTPETAEQTGLPASLPCILGGHDHLCAAAAAGAEDPGTLVDSCGTAESLLVTVDQYQPTLRLLKSGYVMYAHVLPARYVVRGGLRSAGGAIQWLAKCLSGESSGESIPFELLMEEASTGVGRRVGPLWLPHFLGSGTPHDDPHSLAAMVGLKYEHNRGDIFRGLLESLAFWLRQNLEQIEVSIDRPIEEVVLLGGTTRMNLLNQLKATVLNRQVIFPQIAEPSALGAALLAGIGIRQYKNISEAAATIQHNRVVITPDIEKIDWYNQFYKDTYINLYSGLKEINASFASITEENVDLPLFQEG